MPILCYVIIALGAYLLGSIPFGFLAAKARGIDIRSVGSGNIGATNAMRVLGRPMGIAVLLLDVLKGWLACCLGEYVYVKFGPTSGIRFFASSDEMSAWLYHLQYPGIVAGIFAVLGHNYTCWLNFKGGKGIATTAGVYLALAWPALLVAFVVFILALLTTRYVSVASMSAAIALPATIWIMQPHNILLGSVTTALGALAIYKHKSNIQRLRNGTESRFGKKSQAAADCNPRSK